MTQKKKSKPKSKKKNVEDRNSTPSKSMLFKYFQVVFYLLGIWYLVAGLIFLFALITLRFNSGLFFDQAIMELIKFPIIGFVPLPLTFSGVLFLYAGLKIIMGSKRGFWTAVIVLIGVPLMIMIMNTMIHYLEFQSVSDVSSFVEYYFGSEYFKFNELDVIFYLVFFGSFIILLLSYKKFRFPDKLISQKSRNLLVILTLFGVVPSLLFGIYSYFSLIKTDYGYEKVQDQLDFNILKPEWLPQGVSHATFYYLDDDETYGRGSEVYFDKDDSTFFSGNASVDNKIISIKQYEYDETKDVRYYHDSYLELISEENNECTTKELSLTGIDVESYLTHCVTAENPDPNFARYTILVTVKNGNVVYLESPSLLISTEDLMDIVGELD